MSSVFYRIVPRAGPLLPLPGSSCFRAWSVQFPGFVISPGCIYVKGRVGRTLEVISSSPHLAVEDKARSKEWTLEAGPTWPLCRPLLLCRLGLPVALSGEALSLVQALGELQWALMLLSQLASP